MFTSIIIEILKTCFCNDDRPAFVDKKGVLFSEFGDVIYFFDVAEVLSAGHEI